MARARKGVIAYITAAAVAAAVAAGELHIRTTADGTWRLSDAQNDGITVACVGGDKGMTSHVGRLSLDKPLVRLQ